MHNMIKGTYIFYENGKEIYRSPNIITKFGKRFFTNIISGNILSTGKDMAFGIDTTTATVNDTRLGFEFYRSPISIFSTDIQTSEGVTTYSVVYKTTIPQNVSGLIGEIGLYPSNRTSTNNYDGKFITDASNFLDWTTSTGFNPEIISNTSLTTYGKIGGNVLRMSSDTTSAQEYISSIDLDLSGYSLNDSITLAYYKFDNNLENITIKFYHTNNDYYSVTITPPSGTGYKISDDIPLSTLFTGSIGAADRTQITKIGFVIDPTAGNSTQFGLDGLRINDEDTFDPTFGLLSRSVLNSPYLEKLAGRQVDVEYRLDLDF